MLMCVTIIIGCTSAGFMYDVKGRIIVSDVERGPFSIVMRGGMQHSRVVAKRVIRKWCLSMYVNVVGYCLRRRIKMW